MEAHEAATATIVCPDCRVAVATPYCGYCGRLLRDDVGVPLDPKAFVREGTVEALGLDRRIVRTARDTLGRPAEVIRTHLAGRGAQYVHPLKYQSVECGQRADDSGDPGDDFHSVRSQ